MSKNYICGGNTFTYRKGYIALPLELKRIPETIEVDSIILHRKDEFHISLLCVKNILENLPNAEEQILKSFCEYVQEKNISFVKFTGEFRFAEKEERKTVVALCEMENLKEFFNRLSAELSVTIPHQPTHVTVYTLQPNAGIGLNSPEDLVVLSRVIEVSREVKKHFSN